MDALDVSPLGKTIAQLRACDQANADKAMAVIPDFLDEAEFLYERLQQRGS